MIKNIENHKKSATLIATVRSIGGTRRVR